MNEQSRENGREPVVPEHVLTDILSGQTALVTGANSGIGKGVALALGAAGANVVVNYVTDPDSAQELAEKISENGVRAMALKADVSREDEVGQMFSRIRKEFGTLHILVNNAGIQDDAPFADMSIEQWNKVIGVNLTGQFLCSRAAVREFRRRGAEPEVSSATGKIICMSSVHQEIPWAGHVNYTASKGGILMMMKTIAQEVAADRIRVNAIAPGAIRTPINRQAWESEDAYERLMTKIPYDRIGETRDVGRMAVWLASDLSDYVTGATMYVDGGMMLYPGFTTGG